MSGKPIRFEIEIEDDGYSYAYIITSPDIPELVAWADKASKISAAVREILMVFVLDWLQEGDELPPALHPARGYDPNNIQVRYLVPITAEYND